MNLNDFFSRFQINQTLKRFDFSDLSTDNVVGISYFCDEFIQTKKENILVVAPTLFAAEQIRNQVASLIGEEKVVYIPSEELVMVEYTAASSEILSDRIFGLYSSLEAKNKVIITNIAAVMRYFPSVSLFKSSIISIKKNDDVNISFLRKQLLNNGYEFVNKVAKTGQFAIRGDILDIYSYNNDYPIRIEFFDTIVESLQNFNISTQESFKSIDSAIFIPASEQLYTDEELYIGTERIREQLVKDLELPHNTELEGNTVLDIESLKSYSKESKLYKYFSFISQTKASLFSYFDCKTLLFSDLSECEDSYNNLIKDARDFLYDLSSSGKNITHLSLYNERYISYFSGKIISNKQLQSTNVFAVRTPTFLTDNIHNVKTSFLNFINNGYKIYLSFNNEQQKLFYLENVLKEIFKEQDLLQLLDNTIFIGLDDISLGFELYESKVVVLTQKELFGFRFGTSKFTSKFRESSVLKNYDELEIGDYVVHENYGIGKFDGIKQITTEGITNDFIKINYEGNAALYVPLEQFRLVRKYVSKEGYVPKLSKLFTDKWEKTKKKIKERVNLLADKLTELYKAQLSIKGFQFGPDDEFQKMFENDFEYQLTKDQEAAIDDVKKDMESPYPMDRLVCGDVGFGKTEVAFRAAFKAIMNHKQVLLLCPTTLLAKQHYERAIERFSKYDIAVTCMTRFMSSSEFSNALRDVKDGKIHFIIGTHKVLSNRLIFNDLGLLIIDEEQRFGVEQKEKIKMKFPNIDTLTLSATPIPRTLQISLIGMKALSIINTPPKNRAPIQTYLVEFNEKIIMDIIKRELGRKGQVYYLHNEVDDIPLVAEKIRQSIPNASVAFIHGQMDKDVIDDIMTHFYNGEVQVLVTTSIIENGIDVPNANLIIVENANRFGLAQLYQIKGRVGRSDKLAYAYLTYKKNKNFNEDATKRLKAIKEFTELGSGYKIAQRDLMIRGAGDILGPEQAGFIDDVGVDLYIKLLNEAISEKKGEIRSDISKIEYKKIMYSSYIPDKYANDENKFEIYQLINDCKDEEELNKAEAKIKDEFGKIPAETERIIKIKRLKLKLESVVIDDYEEYPKIVSIYLSKSFKEINGIGSTLFSKLYKYGSMVDVHLTNGNIKITLKKDEKWVDTLIDLINVIITLYNEVYENR